MTESIHARLSGMNRELTLNLLFESLGADFVERDGVWAAELFGGTSFLLTSDKERQDCHLLEVSIDRTNPRFAEQQKVFGPIEGLRDLLTKVCGERGVICVWGSGE